jgi:CubicO group peptidase (beta-lactamase class C family)
MNRNRSRSVSGFLALLLASSALAQSASRPESLPISADLEARLEKIRAKYDLPALGAAATSGSGLLAIGVTGVRRKDSTERVTADDLWHLGSCTKSMTATMLARLVERGKLRWETTIGEVFADLADSGKMKDPWKPVTLELLLAHRAGAPSDLSADGLWGRLWERKGTPTEQRRQLLEGVLGRDPVSPPGTAYLYSNAGIAIAGHMAERLTGRSWEDLMLEELCAPLGMKAVGFGAPGSAEKMDAPWGHAGAESKPVAPGPKADNPPAIGPGGTMHASLADWAKYAAAHLLGSRRGGDYLKPETWLRIQAKPEVGDYSFGWGHHQRPWGGGHVLSHSGSNTMWFCVIWLAPNRDVAYLATTNCGGNGAARATDEAVQALMAVLRGRPASNPTPGFLEWTKRRKAEMEVTTIKEAINLFRLSSKSGALPEPSDFPRCIIEPSAGNGGEPFLDPARLTGGKLLDPWGNEYVYIRNRNAFEVISYGSDGAPAGEGAAADISSNRRPESRAK